MTVDLNITVTNMVRQWTDTVTSHPHVLADPKLFSKATQTALAMWKFLDADETPATPMPTMATPIVATPIVATPVEPESESEPPVEVTAPAWVKAIVGVMTAHEVRRIVSTYKDTQSMTQTARKVRRSAQVVSYVLRLRGVHTKRGMKLLHRVPANERHAKAEYIRDRYLQGWSLNAISGDTGICIGTVRRTLKQTLDMGKHKTLPAARRAHHRKHIMTQLVQAKQAGDDTTQQIIADWADNDAL